MKLVGHTVSGISDLNVQSFIKCMFVYVFRVHWCCGGGGDGDGNGGALQKTNTRLVLTKFLLMFLPTLYSVLESAINRLREFFEKAANKSYLSISHCIWSNLWMFDFVRAYLVSINKSNRAVCKLSATHWEKLKKREKKSHKKYYSWQ